MTDITSVASNLISLPAGVQDTLSIRAKALVFADPASLDLLRLIEQVGPSDVPALILGETGTGKELVARHLHRVSGRKGAFIAVNCGAINAQLAESELFGHEAGAFTDARGNRQGHFEEADGGTLFLDEIGDLPLSLQIKLLRVLQEGEITRVGTSRCRRVDVRLIAATNVDLERAVRAGNFRLDLLYRINLARLRVPPLRERPLDILLLAEHFRDTYCRRMKRPAPRLSDGAMAALRHYPWPGNIRELENVMHLALLVSEGAVIEREHLRFSGGLLDYAVSSARATEPPDHPQDEIRRHVKRLFQSPSDNLLRDIEAVVVSEAFQQCRFNQVRTAHLLGVTRNTMRTLLMRHGLLADQRHEGCERVDSVGASMQGK